MSSVRQETLQNLRFVIGERKDKYIFMFEYIEANLKVIDMETSFGENLITSFKAGIK